MIQSRRPVVIHDLAHDGIRTPVSDFKSHFSALKELIELEGLVSGGLTKESSNPVKHTTQRCLDVIVTTLVSNSTHM